MNKLLFIILYLVLSSCTGPYYLIEDDRPTIIYQRTSLDNYCNICNTHYTYHHNHNHNWLYWHSDIKPNNKPHQKPNNNNNSNKPTRKKRK